MYHPHSHVAKGDKSELEPKSILLSCSKISRELKRTKTQLCHENQGKKYKNK